MFSLQAIYKYNDQDPKLALSTGKLRYNQKVGCWLYNPPQFLKLSKKSR